MHSLRHWSSFFVGVLIFLFGLFPLIGKDEWLFFLGGNVYGNIAMYLVAFGGLYIIIDSFFEFTFHSGIGIATLLVGLLVFAIGLITILHNFGMIAFSIPFVDQMIVWNILFILEGLFLMLGCFVMD
jgi:hypothetical protein